MCPFECATLDDRVMGPEVQNTCVTREWGGAKKQPCNTVKGPTVDDHIVKEIKNKCGGVYGVKSPSIECK